MKRIFFVAFTFFCFFSNVSANSTCNYKEWTMWVANSEMKRNPELWTSDFAKELSWNYAQALEEKAFMQLYKVTGEKRFCDYVLNFADTLINDAGVIVKYDFGKYNIDFIAGGNVFLDAYDVTKNEKYLKGINLLRKQLDNHPRVSEGAFWHKQIYPHQVWLDGLYMGSPFYARYSYTFKDEKAFDDVTNQFMVCDRHTRDAKTGLNYHAWDESHNQKWSNPVTGQSPNFWSRSIGWYVMAIVDVLDYLPENHPKRLEMIKILNRVCTALLPYQEKKTGMWYQVTNFPERKGNYLESTGTTMFMYAMAKGANKGYLPKKFRKIAESTFQRFTKSNIKINADGTVSIMHGCIVAGLGGATNRSGTFEYYINEPFRDDDPKAIGPYILAGLELTK